MPDRRKKRKATTAEGRVNTLVDMAVDIAEEQLRTNSIAPATLNQLLKLATTKDRLEITKLEKEVALLHAKTLSLENAEKQEELFKEAMRAFSGYRGDDIVDDDEKLF